MTAPTGSFRSYDMDHPSLVGSLQPIPPTAIARATRYVAAHAVDAQDCADLCAMLGLNPQENR